MANKRVAKKSGRSDGRSGKREAAGVLSVLAWLVGLALGLPTAYAQEPSAQRQPSPLVRKSEERIVGIALKGSIVRASVDKIRAAASLASAYAIPAPLVVFLDSSGGDGLAAIDIGRILRLAHAHVFVTGRCASACILVFAGGVYRAAPPNTLGIHRGRLTQKRDGRMAEVPLEGNDKAQEVLARAEDKTEAYFAEMGMPDMFGAMQAVPTDRVKWLSAEEAVQLRLTGFDNAYVQSYSRDAAMRFRIAEADVLARSATVLDNCANDVGQAAAFIACYKRQLMGLRPSSPPATAGPSQGTDTP